MNAMRAVLLLGFGCILVLPLCEGHCGVEADYEHGEKIRTLLYEFRFLALIEHRTPYGQIKFGCTASIITHRYLVTAAHCVTGNIINTIGYPDKVRIGEYDTAHYADCEVLVGDISDCALAIVRNSIAQIIVHPEFKPNDPGSRMRNDIALLETEYIEYTFFVCSICLPSRDITLDPNFDSLRLKIMGWGTLNPSNASSKKQVSKLSMVNLTECQNLYRNNPVGQAPVWDKQICAKGSNYANVSKGPCIGDGGGPLIQYNKKGVVELIGVTSYGPTHCEDESTPFVYTNVFKYVDWINSKMYP